MYILTIMVRFLRHDKFKFISLSFCLALGMLIGTMFVCQAYEAWYSYFDYEESIAYEQIIIVQTEDNLIKLSEDADIYESIKFINNVAPYRYYVTDLITFNQEIMIGVSVIGTNTVFYNMLSDSKYIVGRWFDSEKECVIGEKIANRYQVSMGDTIVINNYSYEVVGINNILKYSEIIFIDDTAGSIRYDSTSIFDSSTYKAGFNNMQKPQYYYVYLNEKVTDDNMLTIQNYIIKKYKSGNFIKGHNRIIDEKNQLHSGWGMSIILSIVSIFYGVINIHNIEKFYYMKRKKTYGILLAHGATKKQLFTAVYFESGIITLFSSIILFIGVYLLSISRINYRVSMRVDLYVFATIFLAGQMYSLIYSWINTRSLQKQSIRTIF